MSSAVDKIKYPRRVLLRKGMTSLGKLLLAVLAQVEINGESRLPKNGPLIIAGNHVAVLEAVMMAVYTPAMVEFIGTGDIPFDPNYAFIANAYGLVPINRGNLDRRGLKMGMSVLEQNGVLGIFPEGGTWNPAQMQAQTGVAWLSYRTQTPVLPIGFGGMKGGLQKAFRFKRPKLVVNVGHPIPPVTLVNNEISMKANLENAANQILKEINALVPEQDLLRFHQHLDETFELKISVHDLANAVAIPDALFIKHGAAYARFLYSPALMDVLVRNLHLPIKPIRKVTDESNLMPLIAAWKAILDYLKTNPGYFTYRFGMEEGLAVKQALEELCQLSDWVFESGYRLSLRPIRRYRNGNTGAQVVERCGRFPKSMRP